MIRLQLGDLVANVRSGHLVHGVNAQGDMKSGIAGVLRSEYPVIFDDYKKWEADYGLNLGDIIVSDIYRDDNDLTVYDDDLFIINAVTQEFYGRDPNVRYLSYDGLQLAFENINKLFIDNPSFDRVLHFPLIGCGLANGDWEIASDIIDKAIDDRIDKFLWLK